MSPARIAMACGLVDPTLRKAIGLHGLPPRQHQGDERQGADENQSSPKPIKSALVGSFKVSDGVREMFLLPSSIATPMLLGGSSRTAFF